MRVGTTQKFSKSFVPLLISCFERRRSLRSLWAVRCQHGGPGMPTLAVSGWHEGVWQDAALESPCVPDRPFRQCSGKLRQAVLRCTEVDWGHQAHPSPACSCCLHPATGVSASVYSSTRAVPGRRPHAANTAVSSKAAPWSQSQGGCPTHAGPRQIIFNQSAHSPLTSGINEALSSTQLPLTGYFLFFEPFSKP